ncbi:hypothetical protein ACJD0Z_15465 [Flavobacteriaceae bacterium M23B6Z8]
MILVLRLFLPKRFIGITIWPFIFIKSKELKQDKKLVNHERIHLRQQLELLVIPFYVWYVFEYGIRWMRYGNRKEAYRNICFEREAYTNEHNELYLKQRNFWSFLKYMKRP